MGTSGAGPFDWDDLYRRHAPDLQRLIARQVPSNAIEDVLQETFVRAFRSHDRFDPACDVWPWLATLAHRSCTKWWRSHRAAEALTEHEVTSPTSVTSPGSDEHLLRFEQRRAATTALAQLAPRHRRVLYRHAAEDVPYERIADDEAISPQALKSLLNRARVHFRQHYLRLLEESAGLLVLGRTALARLRARLSEREVVLWERLAPMAGTVFVAGVVGVLTVPSGPAPARAATTRIAAVKSVGTMPSQVLATEAHTAPVARAIPAPESRGLGSSSSPNRIVPPRTPEFAGSPVRVMSGGEIISGPNSSTVGLWLEVADPFGMTTTRVGTEVRCEAAMVFTLECMVLRALPPTT